MDFAEEDKRDQVKYFFYPISYNQKAKYKFVFADLNFLKRVCRSIVEKFISK